MDRSRLDKLRYVADAAAALRRDPDDATARSHRDEAVFLAACELPTPVVAEIAGLSVQEVRAIVRTRRPVGKRTRRRWFPPRPKAGDPVAGGRPPL